MARCNFQKCWSLGAGKREFVECLTCHSTPEQVAEGDNEECKRQAEAHSRAEHSARDRMDRTGLDRKGLADG